MKLLLVLLLSATQASAATYSFKKQVEVGTLESELKAANFAVESISCANDDCKIILQKSEKKDPMSIVTAHVYHDPKAVRTELLNELALLESKLDDDTATAGDVRRAVKLILKLHGWARK